MNETIKRIMGRTRFFIRNWIRKGLSYARHVDYFSQHYMTKNIRTIDKIYQQNAYPTYLEIEVTTYCNLKCVFCEHTYWKEPNRHMPYEQFEKIIAQFPRIDWIGLTGIGESFLHPDFDKMVRLVKKKGAFLELYDTFYFIDEKRAEFLLRAPVESLIISLDAATADTYQKLRVNSNFERVTTNLKRMFAIRKDKKLYETNLYFHFVINSINIHEALDYLDLVKEIAQEEPTRVTYSRMLHCFPETEYLFTELPDELFGKVMEKAKTLNLKVSWNADAVLEKPYCSTCTAWTMPFIFVTGEVIPCCAKNEANKRDDQKRLSMGNIFNQDMKSIWYGENYTNLRKSLAEGKLPEVCNTCSIYRQGTHRQH